MPDCTSAASWQPALISLSLAAAALLSAIAASVAHRGVTTSRDVQSTQLAVLKALLEDSLSGEHSASLQAALDRRKPKSGTRERASTSTLPGDRRRT